uniref:OSJNBa0085H03.1 protein n=2 Tax=Oryza sativa subsp. japonica TaxID=39947 RepID=A0A5S6RCF4_ORYSJ|nr:OSJNBa0085H03.1 [Oryza sativa Japonica Group]CAE05429.2 OSJNBa0035I04.17 [Oryza sativa Japonica Group]
MVLRRTRGDAGPDGHRRRTHGGVRRRRKRRHGAETKEKADGLRAARGRSWGSPGAWRREESTREEPTTVDCGGGNHRRSKRGKTRRDDEGSIQRDGSISGVQGIRFRRRIGRSGTEVGWRRETASGTEHGGRRAMASGSGHGASHGRRRIMVGSSPIEEEAVLAARSVSRRGVRDAEAAQHREGAAGEEGRERWCPELLVTRPRTHRLLRCFGNGRQRRERDEQQQGGDGGSAAMARWV